ncbi:MAG TPA: hypothetical protein VEK07_21890 [Polyangiaceae bacterium]|nr:hypothetical protein [Polyangiaceae bacterium]
MEIRVEAKVPFSSSVVFVTYRDDMAKLLPYLPNVRAFETESRTEVGSRVDVVNVWRGGGEVPGVIRAVLSESMLAWTDHARWDAEAMRCDWRTETLALKDAVRCEGYNTFVPEGPDTTVLEMRGSLVIDAKKLRLPGFLAGKISGVLEEFLVSKIEANFLETAKGMKSYLQRREPAVAT